MNSSSLRTILVTGANGFLGKNLLLYLAQFPDIKVTTFLRTDDPSKLVDLLSSADAVVHLAGENRPINDSAFVDVNVGLTTHLCKAISTVYKSTGRHIPLVFTSSIHASQDTQYGRSKYTAEQIIQTFSKDTQNPCIVFRLPGVFGKWCKPSYNSVVATFCHNVAHGRDISVDNPKANLSLVYIDDVIKTILLALESPSNGYSFLSVSPEYQTTVGDLADTISSFRSSRESLLCPKVGSGLIHDLYSTYISYLPVQSFSYLIPSYTDPRGTFVEMMKTSDSGQFSFFTAAPGVTRGGHYHNTKTEQFLIVQGQAAFKFRHLITNETIEIQVSGSNPEIVQTIPGWSHSVTNVGSSVLISLLWANEIFDKNNPDTYSSPIDHP